MKNNQNHLPIYKKPLFWIIIVAASACILAAVFWMTSSKKNAAKETKEIDNLQKQSLATLTLEDVLRLSQKGYELTWEDFDCYHYMDTGFGLYIATYDIDDMFYLNIGSSGSDILYIYLCYGFDSYIDIRDNDTATIEKFINEVKDGEAPSCEVPFHYFCFRVSSADDRPDAFDKMFELADNRNAPTMILNCIQNLPVVWIHNRAELDAFCQEMGGYFEFTQPYDRIPAFSEAAEKYDEEFFKTNSLFLIYTYSSGLPEYPDVEFMNQHSIALSIGIMCSNVTEQDTGWLIAVETANTDIAHAASVDSYISSRIMPTTDMTAENANIGSHTYIFEESDDIVKPSVTLFDDGTFSFGFSAMSSYLGHGSYTMENDRLVLCTDDGKYTYTFDMVNDTLVFDADASSEQTWYSGIYDGAVLK